LVIAVLCLAHVGTGAAQEAAVQADPFTILTAFDAPDASRRAAAELLVRSAASKDDFRRLERMLRATTSPAVREALLDAITQMPLAPVEFQEPLIQLVAVGDQSIRPAALAALAAVGSQVAAKVLIDHASAFMPPEVSGAAFDGLIRMSGRDDLGREPAAWSDWFSTHRGLDELEWRDAMIAGLIARHTRSGDAMRAATQRITDVYRRLYLVSPYQDRGGLLAEMLRAEDPLRGLGIELVYRELAQGRQVDQEVGTAAIEMLAGPSPATRIEAARLVATLSPPESGTRLTRALEIETMPGPAKALLMACAKWPRVSAVQSSLRWLEYGAVTRDEAASLLLALDTEGLLTSPSDRRRVAQTLRAAGPRKLNADGLRLAVLTGDDNDREAIAALIGDRDAPTRDVAASALARRPEFAGRVIAAARSDSALYPAAIAATASHRASASGYADLRAIDAPSPEARRAGLLAVARAMEPAEVLEAARSHEPDPELRVAVLSTLGNAAATPDERDAINAAKLLLAQTQLELRRPDAAIAALLQINGASEDQKFTQDSERSYVAALLWLNRIDEALARNAGADDWLAALELIGDEPHAPMVARAALEQFENVLEPAERAMLSTRAALATPADSPTGGG
jgi:hypothetical protein